MQNVFLQQDGIIQLHRGTSNTTVRVVDANVALERVAPALWDIGDVVCASLGTFLRLHPPKKALKNIIKKKFSRFFFILLLIEK